jgi:hypothetical protein
MSVLTRRRIPPWRGIGRRRWRVAKRRRRIAWRWRWIARRWWRVSRPRSLPWTWPWPRIGSHRLRRWRRLFRRTRRRRALVELLGVQLVGDIVGHPARVVDGSRCMLDMPHRALAPWGCGARRRCSGGRGRFGGRCGGGWRQRRRARCSRGCSRGRDRLRGGRRAAAWRSSGGRRRHRGLRRCADPDRQQRHDRNPTQ